MQEQLRRSASPNNNNPSPNSNNNSSASYQYQRLRDLHRQLEFSSPVGYHQGGGYTTPPPTWVLSSPPPSLNNHHNTSGSMSLDASFRFFETSSSTSPPSKDSDSISKAYQVIGFLLHFYFIVITRFFIINKLTKTNIF